MSARARAATFAVVVLIAVTGCTTATRKKSAEGRKREPGPVEEPVASSPPPQSIARGAEKPVEKETEAQREGRGLAAIERAAEAKKYLFIFFQRDDDEQTRRMRRVFDAAVKKVAGRAEAITIDVSDASEKEIVAKLGVGRAPMPLALVLAPNGAVTGGFPTRFDEKQLVEAIVNPGMEECLKALQERKLVLLCIQNERTSSNSSAMRGVQDFKRDPRFSTTAEVVTLDPSKKAEARFLRQLQVDPRTDEAVTVFLAPPGTVIAKFRGATDKDALVAALMSACGSGCGPSSGSTGAG